MRVRSLGLNWSPVAVAAEANDPTAAVHQQEPTGHIVTLRS